VKLGFHQFRPVRGDPDGNLASIDQALRGADADLVVLPELALSGYLFRDRQQALDLADRVPGRRTDALAALCAGRGLHLVCGLAERAGDRLFNSAVLVGPDGLLACYRKVHLFRFEKRIFEPGDGGFAVHEVAGARVGMLVCFDWIYPEAARSLAVAGADVIAHPSNLVLPHAQRALVTRCLENRLFWVLANRTGAEREGDASLSFTGRSRIGAPDGSVLADAGPDGDELRIVDVDPAAARDKRVTPENDLLADRRPDLYDRLVRDR
jgi:predicted amidohydrolase